MAEKPPAHEVQARQEADNAERLGNAESARAAAKRLDAAKANQVEVAADHRKQAAEDGGSKTDRAPQGRRAPAKQQG